MANDDGWHQRDDGSWWSIAGWEGLGGGWNDVEAEGAPRAEDHVSPWNLDQITVHYLNSETGDEIYFTLNGPFEDWDQIDDLIGESLDHYGIAA